MSPAFPPGAGGDFVNAVAAIETALDPADLLAALHRIEAEHGRKRAGRWQARTLDLDLLTLGGLILPDARAYDEWRALPLADQSRHAPDRLILPHPRIEDRAFVLLPLAEIAPDWTHPVSGRTIAELISDLPAADKAVVRPLD